MGAMLPKMAFCPQFRTARDGCGVSVSSGLEKASQNLVRKSELALVPAFQQNGNLPLEKLGIRIGRFEFEEL